MLKKPTLIVFIITLFKTNQSDEIKKWQNKTQFGSNQQEIKDEGFIPISNEENSESYEGSGLENYNKLENVTYFEGSGDNIDLEHSVDENNCIEPGSKSICSKQGKCFNNKCICDFTNLEEHNKTALYKFYGEYCEECTYCKAKNCHKFLGCVECMLFQEELNCNKSCFFKYKTVEQLIFNKDQDEKICDIENTDGCYIKFKYYYNNDEVTVEYGSDIFCFNGLKFIIVTFWGVVIYIFALAFLIPRLCFLSQKNKINRSTISLSSRHDIVRL